MSTTDLQDSLTEVDAYFDRLEDTLDQVDQNLQTFMSVTAAGSFKELDPVTAQLQASLADLESLLDQRGGLLLRLTTNGVRPKSLRQFHKDTGDQQRGERAAMLATRIETQRQRTITIFTAHYWMYETTRDVIRLITNPGPNPGTYGMKVRSQGGGLLDEAA